LLEALPEARGDVERELLLQDDVQERGEAGGPARKAWQAIGREDAREIGIDPRERAGAFLEALRGRLGCEHGSRASRSHALFHGQGGASTAMLSAARRSSAGETCQDGTVAVTDWA